MGIKPKPKLLIAAGATALLSGSAMLYANSSHEKYFAESNDSLAESLYRKNRIAWWSGTARYVTSGGLMVAGTFSW